MTQKDAYPLPLPDQVQDKLSGMSYFTKFGILISAIGRCPYQIVTVRKQHSHWDLVWDFMNLMSFHSDSEVDPAHANASWIRFTWVGTKYR